MTSAISECQTYSCVLFGANARHLPENPVQFCKRWTCLDLKVFSISTSGPPAVPTSIDLMAFSTPNGYPSLPQKQTLNFKQCKITCMQATVFQTLVCKRSNFRTNSRYLGVPVFGIQQLVGIS
jgi:hypothetical protein